MSLKWNQAEERRLYDSAQSVLADELRRRGRNWVLAARARAPVRTGRLRSRIRAEVERDSRGLRMDLISDARDPRTGQRYAGVQEKRRPHLRPAVIALKR